MSSHEVLVVAGGFGIDTNVYALGGRLGAETTFAHTTDGLGQAGCYSALAATALGVPTRAIAALGDDRLGSWVRSGLEAAAIEVIELRDPLGTHRSVNLMAEDGSRRNYFDARGAHAVDIDIEASREAVRGARIVHVHLDDWCRHLLPVAHEEGLTVSCDLQDVSDIDDPYLGDFVAVADVVFMSAANLEDPAATARELARRRPGRSVVVGMGAQGCLVADGDDVAGYGAAVLPEPVADTNGAGDNLAVGFLVARVMDGLPLDRAVGRAQLGARWICTRRGDAKVPLTRSQLDDLERQVSGVQAGLRRQRLTGCSG